MDALLFRATKRHNEKSGQIKLLVDPAEVRQTLSDDNYSFQQIWVLIEELRAVVLEIQAPNIRILGGILDSVDYSKEYTKRDPLTGETRKMWVVHLSKTLAELIKLDLPLYHDPAPITRLNSGITQAIVRHVLTHTMQPQGGWYVDRLIETVGASVDRKALWERKRELNEDHEGLSKLGITIENGRLTLQK